MVEGLQNSKSNFEKQMQINKHLKEIKRSKAEKDGLRTRFNEITKELEEMMLTFNVDDGPTMVSYEQLELCEVGVKMHVNDKVYFVRQKSKRKNELVFITFMKAGGKFGMQVHDCYEWCKIIEGHLVEKSRGYKTYLENETVFYNKNETHHPRSDINSIYEVTFRKNIEKI